MEALTKARVARGWGFERAAKVLGISQQALRNLERNSPTRDTNPGNVTVFTFVAILETFHELDVSDFVAGTDLSVREGYDEGGLWLPSEKLLELQKQKTEVLRAFLDAAVGRTAS